MDVHEPGTLIDGRYRVEQQIGSGGFGAVYKAIDTGFKDRVVAVKEMLEAIENTTATYLADRFEQECEVLERLRHPHIPRIWDHFKTPQSYYLVMDYVEGQTLEEWVEKFGNLTSIECVVRYCLQVCQVLEYLHGQPVPLIHRDIKPANVILKEDGNVVLVDFGLARTLDVETTRTQVGTVGYAGLEQVRGAPEPCSDIYSLGASMYHLLTGLRPKPFQIPDVRQDRPDVPEPVAAIVAKATQQNPARRYLTAARMRQALEEALVVLTGQGTVAPRDFYPEIQSVKDGNLPSSPLPIMIGGAAVLIAMLLFFGLFSGWIADTMPHKKPAPSASPSMAASASAAPAVAHEEVDVTWDKPSPDMDAPLNGLLAAGSRSEWQWTGVSHLDPDGALSADPNGVAAVRLSPVTSGALPQTLIFKLLPHTKAIRVGVSCGGAVAILKLDGSQWTASLEGADAGDLRQDGGEGTWTARYALRVTPTSAELHQEGSGKPLHVDGKFAVSPVTFIVYPDDGYRRLELQDVAVSHDPVDF